MRTTHLPQLPSPVAAHGASCGRPRRYCIPAIVHGPWAAATLRRRGGSLLSSPGDFATAAVAATDEKEEDGTCFKARRLRLLTRGLAPGLQRKKRRSLKFEPSSVRSAYLCWRYCFVLVLEAHRQAGSLLYRKELKPPPPVSDIHLGTAGCQAEAFLVNSQHSSRFAAYSFLSGLPKGVFV